MYSFYESARSKKFGRTSTNMYLQYKWDTENFANHRYNVKTAKPSVDNNAPQTFTHMFVRPKKLQLELERYSTIQRNNRFLMERLAKIEREGAWIDNKNDRQSRSLNTWKRQQEMIHLAYNNQIMIARLQDVKAQHNRTKLEDEYLINQKYKANIQKWPPNWREVQQHLNRVKADIFKKVFDSKYQTEAYRKSRKLELRKWALEKEKHAAAKAERIAQETIDAKKRERIEKEKRKEERKKREEESKKKQKKLEREKKTDEKFKTKLKRNKSKQSTKDGQIKILLNEKGKESDNTVSTVEESTPGLESLAKEQADSDEENQTKQTTSNQDISDEKTSKSKQTVSEEAALKTDQNTSDKEPSQTEKKLNK